MSQPFILVLDDEHEQSYQVIIDAGSLSDMIVINRNYAIISLSHVQGQAPRAELLNELI